MRVVTTEPKLAPQGTVRATGPLGEQPNPWEPRKPTKALKTLHPSPETVPSGVIRVLHRVLGVLHRVLGVVHRVLGVHHRGVRCRGTIQRSKGTTQGAHMVPPYLQGAESVSLPELAPFPAPPGSRFPSLNTAVARRFRRCAMSTWDSSLGCSSTLGTTPGTLGTTPGTLGTTPSTLGTTP